MAGFALTLHLTAPVDAGVVLARCLGARRGRATPLAFAWADSRFDGTARLIRAGEVAVTLQEGTLRRGRHTRELCRLVLTGPADATLHAALALASAGAAIATSDLAAEAAEPDALPALSADQRTGDAFAVLTGHLTGALLRQLPSVGVGTEPVHQMRVAVRRLRSAMGLFRRAVGGGEVAAAQDGLRVLMRLLGPARDWDVFLTGLGPRVAEALPNEPAMRTLLAAAETARAAAYASLAAHLESTAFRALGIRLVWLAAAHPWAAAPDARQAEALAHPLGAHAAHMLGKSWARMEAAGEDIAALPPPALHALRLRGKRMRYACEFFGPLFPDRGAGRWSRRLAALQESLGHLNDAAVAAGLMAALGEAGQGEAGGLVRGYVAASSADLRGPIAEAWRKLRRLEPFWGA